MTGRHSHREKNVNMLTKEDLTPYKNKESYLELARKRQPGSAGYGGTASTSETVRRTVSTDSGDAGGYEDEGSGEAQSVYGGDGSEEGGARIPAGFSQQFSRRNIRPPRSDSSVYQSKRPTGKSLWSGIKNTAKQYSDALTTDTPKKSKSAATKKTTSRKLTDIEAIKMKPKLIEYIIWQSEHLDDFISATTKGHEVVEIWSNLDHDDAEIIADFLISRAKVNETAAIAVRFGAEMMDKIKLGIIIGPRVLSTMKVYLERGFSIGPLYQRRY